jgi:hypothetical protein
VQYGQIKVDELTPRAADRVRVDLNALLAFDTSPEVEVYIRNLSCCGFCCSSSERLAIGSPVTLRIPELGQFPATIMWQLGADAGARFVTPLPLSTVLSIVLAVVKEQLEKHEPGESPEAAG